MLQCNIAILWCCSVILSYCGIALGTLSCAVAGMPIPNWGQYLQIYAPSWKRCTNLKRYVSFTSKDRFNLFLVRTKLSCSENLVEGNSFPVWNSLSTSRVCIRLLVCLCVSLRFCVCACPCVCACAWVRLRERARGRERVETDRAENCVNTRQHDIPYSTTPKQNTNLLKCV